MPIISVMSVVSQISIMCHSHVMSVTCQVSMLWSRGHVTCWSHVYYVDLVSVACWPHASPVNCISLVSHVNRVNHMWCHVSIRHRLHVTYHNHMIMSVTFWSCANSELPVTCSKRVGPMSIVSITCQSCVGHMSVMSLSWVSHVSHMLLTWSRVSYDSVTYQSCVGRISIV